VATRARFRDTDGNSLDEGIALYFAAPASFTGEHVLELQGHGGIVVLDLLVARLLQLGCRAARPGEFSERAFLNGKIDLAQAEAVADLDRRGHVGRGACSRAFHAGRVLVARARAAGAADASCASTSKPRSIFPTRKSSS
jgi:hypothetical protein